MYDGTPPDPPEGTTVQREAFADVQPGLHHLLTDLWSDLSRDQALPPMDMNYEAYHKLDGLGLLRVYTVRWNGDLVGAAVFFVAPSLHHKATPWANSDFVWLRPDARRAFVALRLMVYAHQCLAAEGVHVIRVGTKTYRPALGRLMEHMGYHPVEISYQKVLTP